MTTSDVFALLASVPLSGGLLWFFFGSRPKARPAEVTNKAQRADMVRRGGSTPHNLQAVEGPPMDITFDQQGSGDSTSRAVFPDLNVSASLPAYEKTVVRLVPDRVGDFTRPQNVGPSRVRLARWVLIVGIGLFGLLAVPSVAWAHGDGETEEGYLLVEQALGHLAHDTSDVGIDLAMEKVNDALVTEDQEGVEVPEVEEAKTALEAGGADQARDLLQDSIKQALADQPAATGNQTGTKLVVPGLPGRSGIGGQGWGFLVVSVVVLLLGVGAAFRFRPQDTVGDLRLRLAHSGTGGVPAEGPADDQEGRS